MKYILTIILASLFLFSCDNSNDIDSFKSIDVTEINKEIATGIKNNEDWVMTPVSILNHIYRLQDTTETNGTYAIEQHENVGVLEITLTQEQIPDDSVYGEKRIIQFRQINKSWTILSIKVGYKCYEGRGGHSNYCGEDCP